MELLVTKGLVFTDGILRYKVISLDIYSTVAWARVLVVWGRGKIKAKKLWADARKRYTAMVPRHKGVHMNTP